MNGRDIRLVMLDIDGTIVDSPRHHTVTPELVRTVRAVAAKGIRIGIATGRNYGHMMSQVRDIGFTGPFICNGGAYLVQDGVCLWESLLPPDVLDAAWAQIRAVQGYVEFSGRSTMHTYQTPGYAGTTFQRVGTDDYLHIMGSPDEYAAVRPAFIGKVTMVVDSREKAEALTDYWTHGPFAGVVSLTRSFWFALEITNHGVTKGSGLRMLAKETGIPLSAVMAIGDGDNDAEILRTAGVSFAMGNASPAAIAAARYRAPTVREDGARVVLQRYLLDGAPFPPGTDL